MDGLLGLLANDIVTYSDSGGKVPAARNPIYGADKVARFLLGIARKAPDSLTLRVASINGQPGIVNYINGLLHSIMTLDIVDGRIREIDIVANPDKLRGLPALNTKTHLRDC
jgi:RNA polymerase sigma-70 factor, ECF subfamily